MLIFIQGQFVNCSSLIVSHVWNEAGIFIPKSIDTPTAFTNFLTSVFPGDKMQKIRFFIEARYPSAGFKDQQARVRKVMQDSTFVCNSRQVYDAYKGKTYAMSYQIPPGWHGSDLLPACYHQGLSVKDLFKTYLADVDDSLIEILERVINYIASRYQKYFGGHAMSGDPNMNAPFNSETWQIANDDEGTINNTLIATLLTLDRTPFFDVRSDPEMSADNCDFWKTVAQQIANLYTVEDSSGDKSGVFEGLFGMQVQDPETRTPVIPDL